MKETVETKNRPAKSKRIRLFFLVSLLVVVTFIFVVLRREQTNQEMLLAIQMGEPSKLDSTLKWGADPNRLVGKSNVAPGSLMDLIDALLHPEKNPYNSRPVLITACTVGNPEVVRVLLKHGAYKNYIMTDRRTPLHYAAVRSKSPVIRVLLDYKADFNLKDKLGRTPLHVAAENASPDCCDALLERGAKTEVKDNSNLTPLMTAIVSFRPKNVLNLLRNGASLDDFNSEKYQARIASNQGAGVPNRVAVITNGVFVMTANGSTNRYVPPPGEPFHWAAGQGNLALLKYLYEERLSKEEKKRIGAIDLNAAVLGKKQEIVDYLLQIGVDINATTGGLSVLSVAISNRDFEMAHYLMQRGVRVNGVARSADSPLLQATKWLSQTHDTIYVPKGTLGSRTIFIQDANAVYTVFEDVSGQIQKSRSQDKESILKLIRELVAKGADVKAVNSSGESPMRNVLAESEIFKLFLGKGADVKTPLLRGDSYLMHSANMSPETAESLIRAGVNVNGKTDSGATPLIQAVKFYNPEVAKVLLKHGADPKASDSTGKTALYYATQNGYAPILKLLKAAGVTR